MELLIAVVCGIAGLLALGAALLLPLKLRYASELRGKSKKEVEEIAGSSSFCVEGQITHQ
jgi:hypothetical protein